MTSDSEISSEIRRLLCDQVISDSIPIDLGDYLIACQDGLDLNWNQMEYLVKNQLSSLDYSDLSYGYCLNVVKLLRTYWIESHQFLKTYSNEQLIKEINQYCGWTNHVSDILKYCLPNMTEDDDVTKTYDCILILTSAIDNSLRNIYLNVTECDPPYLLKDLLQSNELKGIFGQFQLSYLQILMGTPNGINLRNIFWHGFPNDQETLTYYPSVLLLILISFGKILFKTSEYGVKFSIRQENAKKSITLPEYFIKIHLNDVDDGNECLFSARNSKILCQIINKSKFINQSHRIFWYKIIENYIRKNYGTSIRLLLPQLELLLRKIYGEINGINVEAKLNSYYIIMDTILFEFIDNSEAVTGQTNKLFDILDEGTLKCIYDIFSALHGPRIRDRVSHGEIDITNEITDVILLKLLSLSFNIICCSSQYKATATLSDFERKFINLFKLYETLYHPNGYLKIEILNALDSLHHLHQIDVPDELESLLNRTSTEITIAVSLLEEKLKCKNLKTKIFFRSSFTYETQLIKFLLINVQNINLCCKTLVKVFRNRCEQYPVKRLRSRQRETLRSQLRSLPLIWRGLHRVLQLLISLYIQSQEVTTDDSKFGTDSNFMEQFMKLLKPIQKYTENMCKYSEPESNEWTNSRQITEDILNYLDNNHKDLFEENL